MPSGKPGFSPFELAAVLMQSTQNGSLAVEGGRDIAPVINKLLEYPFVVKVATRDFHPVDHVSFSTSQASPNNVPFQSQISLRNSKNPVATKDIPIWPPHCVQGTQGAEIIPELHRSRIDHIVNKGMTKHSEMFSAFADVFGNKSSEAASHDLADLLRSSNVSHVFTCGIAGDFCVKCTSLDARREGYPVLVIEDAVRSVDPSERGWGVSRQEMEAAGIEVISLGDDRLAQVLNAAKSA